MVNPRLAGGFDEIRPEILKTLVTRVLQLDWWYRRKINN